MYLAPLKMNSAQVGEKAVAYTRSFKNYSHPDEHIGLMFPIRLFPCCFVVLGFIDWVSVGASSIRRMIITRLSVPLLLPFITLSLLLEDTAGKPYIS